MSLWRNFGPLVFLLYFIEGLILLRFEAIHSPQVEVSTLTAPLQHLVIFLYGYSVLDFPGIIVLLLDLISAKTFSRAAMFYL